MLNMALSLLADPTAYTWGTCSPKSCSWTWCRRSALSSRPVKSGDALNVEDQGSEKLPSGGLRCRAHGHHGVGIALQDRREWGQAAPVGDAC